LKLAMTFQDWSPLIRWIKSRSKKMFNELETVVLAHDLKDHNLTRGDVGTVVHSYACGKAYEVEFVTGEGKTIAVVTLEKSDIRSMQRQEILHVRMYATA